MKSIAYYVTAHGYGHGTRSCDILNALRAAAPNRPISVTTDLPHAFIASRLDPSIRIQSGAFDVGLIQQDAIQVDLAASLEALDQLHQRAETLMQRETKSLRAANTGVVVSDLPALPLAAAQRMGLPNIAVGNFGWNWIYEEFAETDPRWRPHVERITRVYENTDLLLRLPFAEPMSAFPNQIDLPLLARPGNDQRAAIAAKTGADPTKDWVLLSFTALNLSPAAIDAIQCLAGYEFFSVEPLEWRGSSIHTLSRADFSFADSLASCDFTLSKPGFGIVSECVANQKPIIYTERAHFKEYPVLVDSIQRYCRHAFIPNKDLYDGNLKSALDEARFASEPVDGMKTGGAEAAALEILKHLI